MIISIASGKGGTGKTTVSTALALSITEDLIFVDADVEEPNARIFIRPDISGTKPAYVLIPEVDHKKCIACGRCQEVCQFNAVVLMGDRVMVFDNLCHSCGGCKHFCPVNAITEVKKEIGIIETGQKDNIFFIDGRLNIGQAVSPPLIKQLKKSIPQDKTVIIDAPPGTSCPVIEAISDSDYCILVTEPTPFGLNDLKLAHETVKKLNIPSGLIINRADKNSALIDNYCQKENLEVIMRIPFDKKIARNYARGVPLSEVSCKYKKEFKKLFISIKGKLKK